MSRPRSRPESQYIKGSVFLDIPFPLRDDAGDLKGYEWKSTDLIKLLSSSPCGYSPFFEAQGYHFSCDEAEIIAHFIINECVFPEGNLTGLPFVPERWQWTIYLNIYCWFQDDKPEVRRFNEALIYVARKNGKTAAFGAIPALISLFVDPEQRSQNFCCAADTEQATNNFRHASYMVESNKKLLNKLTSGKVRHGLRYMEHNNGRTFKVLSSIADTKHGLSPNYVGIDEVHAHPNSELIDVMSTGTAARSNPLTIYTTTADYDRPSVCNDLYRRGTSISQRLQSDPHFYPAIFEALPTDDWEDEKTWIKANPNFGISIKERYFHKEINKVRNSPKLLNRFLRLHLNVRTSVETSWIFPHIWASTNPTYSAKELLSADEIRHLLLQFPDWFPVTRTEHWNASHIDILLNQYASWYTWFFRKIADLEEAPCFAGYDNSSVKDIASLVLFFPDTHELIPFFWVPAESIEERSEKEQIPYQNWYSSGLINNTPLTTIDESSIVEAMLGEEGVGILEHFTDLHMVAFDPWGSNYISGRLQEAGLNCKAHSQSYAGMNHPCKVLESLMEQKNLFHGGNPVLTWMIGNTMLSQNHNDQIRPDRKRSTDKIDGIVSALMAIGAWLFHDDNMIKDLPGLSIPESSPI